MPAEEDMKALVTGATGFVGSHLAERLVREGLDVVCLARATSRTRWLEGLDVELRTADLDDADALARAVGDADYVFHCAGLTRGRTQQEYDAVNVEGTRRLVQAILRSGAPVRRFLYVSSLAAVGPDREVDAVDESVDPAPVDFYGRSKLGGEQVVLDQAGRLSVTIVRPPAVYGPRDTNFLPFLRVARKWKFVPLLGGGGKRVSFVHARDLAEGIRLAGLSEAAAGQTYFIGGSTHTTGEFVDALSQAMDLRIRRLNVPAWLARLAGEWGELKWKLTRRPQILSRRKIRDALRDRWTCCWDKATRELGYRPNISLVEGLRETDTWCRDQGWYA